MSGREKESSAELKKTRETLEKIKKSVVFIMNLVELYTLKDFLSNANYCVAGPLGSFNKENIVLLIKSLDEKLLAEKGFFFLSEKKLNFSEIKEENDEARLVGLLTNGQWLIVRMFATKIAKIPNPNIELRDCFEIIRIGDRLRNRDCADILLNDGDLYKLIGKFSADIKFIVNALEHKLNMVKMCQKEILEHLLD